MWKKALLALAIASISAFAPMPGSSPEGMGARFIPAASAGLVPLEQVYGGLRKHYGGDPLDAQLLRPKPDVVLYEIQWLTNDGRKLVFTVNARDGAIVATRGTH